MIFKSIQWRLQAWHGIILFIVLAGFGLTVHRLQRANELRRVDDELHQRVNLLARSLERPARRGPPPPRDRGEAPAPAEPRPFNESAPAGTLLPDPVRRGGPREHPAPPPGFRLGPEAELLFGGSESDAFHYVIWRRDGWELSRSSNAPADITMPTRAETAVSGHGTRTRGQTREAFHFTPPGECLLAGRSLEPELARLREFAIWLAALGGGVLVLGLAGGWWMATRAIRPISEISATASRISAGHLAERISVADTDDELGRLAGVLNSTFARLEAAFARQQQFTADASHELRTPISVVLNQTQTALARERPAAEYREALAACERAAQRMRQLTDSLLTLARLDAAHEAPKRERFELARAARECIDLVRPLAAERGQSIRTELEPAECCGDPERLALVITNLLTNAVQYNRDAGEIHVATRRENGSVMLTVTDQGTGVPAKSLERIFERFHRADESRNRHTGGVGLGLAIVKSCVEACGGSVTASNVQPHGLRMIIRLPAAPTDPANPPAA